MVTTNITKGGKMQIIKRILLSEVEPHQISFPGGMSWSAGDILAIFYDEKTGEYGYFFYGIGHDGLAYESENTDGFKTADEAEADAMRKLSSPCWEF